MLLGNYKMALVRHIYPQKQTTYRISMLGLLLWVDVMCCRCAVVVVIDYH